MMISRMVICVNRVFEIFLSRPFGREGSEGSEGSEGGGFLRLTGLTAGGFLGLTGPSAPRVVDCPSGNTYKVSVTGFTFSVIWHDKHSADWLAALASPYPASPDFPLFRGQNKTPRNTLFINGSTVSTGYSATVEVLHRTSKWGEVRRLACPLRRFPFAAPPNCGGGGKET